MRVCHAIPPGSVSLDRFASPGFSPLSLCTSHCCRYWRAKRLRDITIEGRARVPVEITGDGPVLARAVEGRRGFAAHRHDVWAAVREFASPRLAGSSLGLA